MPTIYEEARSLAEEALAAIGEQEGKGVSADRLLTWVRDNRRESANRVERSWATYLTKMVRDPESKVIREPGRYGFMLRDERTAEEFDEAAENRATTTEGEIGVGQAERPEAGGEAIGARAHREGRLYHLLAEWLKSGDFRAEDTSSARGGGQWGNPDVIGLKVYEGIGGIIDVELISIEAKISLNNWKKEFFEAVAHKRFADRAYFCFSIGTHEPSVANLDPRLFQELREYGEKYKVGILVVFLAPEEHKHLMCASAGEVSQLLLANARVEELWPAVFDPVPRSTRENFLRNALKITNIEGLLMFGTDPEA